MLFHELATSASVSELSCNYENAFVNSELNLASMIYGRESLRLDVWQVKLSFAVRLKEVESGDNGMY